MPTNDLWGTLADIFSPRSASAEVRANSPEAQALINMIGSQRGTNQGTDWRARTLETAKRVPQRVNVDVVSVHPYSSLASTGGYYAPGEIIINERPSFPGQTPTKFVPAPQGGTTLQADMPPVPLAQQVETLGHELGHFLYNLNRPVSPETAEYQALTRRAQGLPQLDPRTFRPPERPRPPLPIGLYEEDLADFLGGRRTIPPGQEGGVTTFTPGRWQEQTQTKFGRPVYTEPWTVSNSAILQLLQQLWGQR